MDCREKMQSSELGIREYVEALEVERQKIQVFRRELPLCFDIVTQTIERCKQQMSSGAAATTEYLDGHQSEECNSEQTCSEAHHVFEEFIPLKRSCSNSDIQNNNNNKNGDDDDEQELESPAVKSTDEKDNMVIDSKNKKEDWLRSVQLWNDPTPDPPPKQESAKKASVVATEAKRNNGGAFQPFQREKNVVESNDASSSPETPAASPTTKKTEEPASSTAGGKREEQKDGQRKQRRNWSPELHKRFLNALQQLGGSHAATPKQIRELMKVDGLTNDEVKSHLQKYRLHTRRPTQSMTNNNGNGQPAQVVFVGGIWVQPPEYTAAETTRIYTPVAAPVAVHHNKHHSEISDDRACRTSQHSNSPATSSSTHTTTTSHAF